MLSWNTVSGRAHLRCLVSDLLGGRRWLSTFKIFSHSVNLEKNKLDVMLFWLIRLLRDAHS